MQVHAHLDQLRVCDQLPFTVVEPLSCKNQLYFGVFFNLSSPLAASREESPVPPLAAAVVQPQGYFFVPAGNDCAWDAVKRFSKACARLRLRFLTATMLQVPGPVVSRILERAWKMTCTL